MDRRSNKIRDAAGVREKFGVEPALIPDFLALVGDAADGYPGIAGIGPIGAARLLNNHGIIENLPVALLGNNRDLALLFKRLATLRADAPLFSNIDELRWRGPAPAFTNFVETLDDPRLLQRCMAAANRID
jgi:5'-3' exonuclease